MFYCDECRISQAYPESIHKSFGTCELCGFSATCNDIPYSSIVHMNSVEITDVKEKPPITLETERSERDDKKS